MPYTDERQAVALGITFQNRVPDRVFQRFRVKNDLLVSEMDDAIDVRHDEDISSDDDDDVGGDGGKDDNLKRLNADNFDDKGESEVIQ